MSEIKVVKRLPKPSRLIVNQSVPLTAPTVRKKNYKIIAIGTSTGGPIVVEKILSSLPMNYEIPIVLVQHITDGFVQGYIDWLNASSKIKVILATDGAELLPGFCYVAPDNYHLSFSLSGRIALMDTEPENNSKPSVSVLFRSVAQVFGNESVGILLTGMGKDGSAELGLIKEKGGITIAQDSESSLVFGMPSEAIKNHHAQFIYSPERIVSYLTSLIGHY